MACLSQTIFTSFRYEYVSPSKKERQNLDLFDFYLEEVEDPQIRQMILDVFEEESVNSREQQDMDQINCPSEQLEDPQMRQTSFNVLGDENVSFKEQQDVNRSSCLSEEANFQPISNLFRKENVRDSDWQFLDPSIRYKCLLDYLSEAAKIPPTRETIFKIFQRENVNPKERQDFNRSVRYHCLLDSLLDKMEAPRVVYSALLEPVLESIERVELNLYRLAKDSPSLENRRAFLRMYVEEWRKFHIQCINFPRQFIAAEWELAKNKHFNGKRKNGSVLRKCMCENWTKIFYKYHYSLFFCALYRLKYDINDDKSEPNLAAEVFRCIAESYLYLNPYAEKELKSYLGKVKEIYIRETKLFYLPFFATSVKLYGVREIVRYMQEANHYVID